MNFAELVLESGRTALDIALYKVLPVMVVMQGITRVLEARGVLAFLVRIASPLTRAFGVSGLGLLAAAQTVFVGFVAPVPTLAVMEQTEASRRRIAATLAMVLATSQANATFPLAAAGLDFGVVLFTSMVGGLGAAAVTYYGFARSARSSDVAPALPVPATGRRKGLHALLVEGGAEAVQLVASSIPVLILTMLVVNLFRASGCLAVVTAQLSPVMDRCALPPDAVVPLSTKYVAGGTAMTATMLDMVASGVVSTAQLNRVAGIMINPLDPVGLAVLLSAGRRVASVAVPAAMGGACGILVRALLHGLIF